MKATFFSYYNFISHWQISIQKDHTDSWLYSTSASKKLNSLTMLLLRYSWFNNLKIWLVESFFDHAKLKIYKPPFTFLKSISASQKSSLLINSYMRNSWSQNSAIWLAEGLFALTKLKIFKPTFIFFNLSQHGKKSHWLTSLFLRYR